MPNHKNLNAPLKHPLHTLTPEKALALLNSNPNGLTDEEAERRLREYGKNMIKKKRGWRKLKILATQFNDALVWILLAAAFLALFFGEIRDVIIISTIVLINASVGFFQEYKAEAILSKLRNFITDTSTVLRFRPDAKGKDGTSEKKEIDTSRIALGDIVSLAEGDDVPADGLLIEDFGLRINGFVFSGESKDEARTTGAMEKQDIALADINNMVFLGETVARGVGKFVVTATGMETELGHIATLAQEVHEEPTPLQRKMKKLGKEITILSVTIGAIIMIIGYFLKIKPYETFLFALALAVSVVPEGLPAAISVALSGGMKKLLKGKVLAKKLSAVETLGSVAIICTDKTGTLTKNELAVVKAITAENTIDISGNGYEPKGDFSLNGEKADPKAIPNLELLLKIGTLASDASLVKKHGQYRIIGDPTEGAIIVAGKKLSKEKDYFLKGEEKIGENPFSSDRMMMSVIYRGRKTVSYAKGSPDVLIGLCDSILIGESVIPFSPEEKERIKAEYNLLSGKALRVLALAFRDLDGLDLDLKDENALRTEAEKSLTWCGLLAMTDPPRQEVKAAIADCQALGIQTIMITGDYAITAEAIAKNIGLLTEDSPKDMIISGQELISLSDQALFDRIKNGTCVFARISPAEKLRIASVLIDNKKTIAMTGDGVNDAPALKRADIGIAMGLMGTDVSKEAADMILLDDNFASIVNGIKEGRTIFINLRKFVYYIFSSNASELFTVIFGILLHVPAPISAVQILSIDLATDLFPSFSLGFEPPENETDNKKQNNFQKDIIDKDSFKRIIMIGLVMAACGTLTFLLSMMRGGWQVGGDFAKDSSLYVKSTTATYAVLAMTQMANLLHARSEKLSPFVIGFFKNRFAIFSIFISFFILLGLMYVPLFQKYLMMAPIDAWDWVMVAVSFVVVFLFEEGRKKFQKSKFLYPRMREISNQIQISKNLKDR